eukprot:9322170-Pyramimonas_sp.AAC.1
MKKERRWNLGVLPSPPASSRSSHLRPEGSSKIGRPRAKWTDQIYHFAVHAEMRTCAVVPTRATGWK